MANDPNDPSSWMRFVKADLVMAQRAMDEREPYPEMACYHAQQAAEKALKALLVAKGSEFARTHSLVYLIRLVAETGHEDVLELMDAAATLQQYAAPARYPTGETVLPDEADATLAIGQARTIVDFVQPKLGNPNNGGN